MNTLLCSPYYTSTAAVLVANASPFTNISPFGSGTGGPTHSSNNKQLKNELTENKDVNL